MSVWLQLLLNGLMLISVILPAIRACSAGFAKTVLQFFRYLIALALSLLFVSPLGALLKRAWLDRATYDLIYRTVQEKVDLSTEAAAFADALPRGVRRLLAVFRFDLDAALKSIEATGDEMLRAFAKAVSDRVSSIAAALLAFVLVFAASLFVLFLLSRVLRFLLERLAFLERVDRVFGLLLGLAVGVLCASVVSQPIVAILTAFTEVDYSAAPLLRFFHDNSPLRWAMLWVIRRMQ